MKVLQVLLILFAWHAEARSIESQEEAIDKAAVDALKPPVRVWATSFGRAPGH